MPLNRLWTVAKPLGTAANRRLVARQGCHRQHVGATVRNLSHLVAATEDAFSAQQVSGALVMLQDRRILTCYALSSLCSRFCPRPADTLWAPQNFRLAHSSSSAAEHLRCSVADELERASLKFSLPLMELHIWCCRYIPPQNGYTSDGPVQLELQLLLLLLDISTAGGQLYMKMSRLV